MKNTILTAVALTNQSFINSQINYRIELVYAGQTNYTESGFSTDLTRFRVSLPGISCSPRTELFLYLIMNN